MKDPAFLFYSSDFLTGTMLMTDEQVGKYIKLLCVQHQKGNLTKEHMINICKSYDKDIFDKFRIDENGLYYNERLRIEIEKRSKYCESRRANRISANKDNHMSEHMSTHMLVHMENENENININKDINIKEVKEKKEIEKTWRNDFETYLSDCKRGYASIINDSEFMERLQKLNPKINIRSSLEMGFIAYWGSEEGWKNKKAKKSKTIDWKSTIIKTIKLNAVYY